MSVILCTAGYDHTIRFWEALSGICSRTIQHPDSQVNRLCISPDKRFLAAAGHHTVKLFDIKSTNPNPLLTFEGHTGNITGVAFHCEGKWMVTSSEDGTVKIWETRSGQVQRSYSHGCPANDVVIHPNQGEIISCDRNGSVRVWDLAENNCSHQLIPEEDVSVSSVTVASDGSLLCAANNAGNVFVWQLLQAYDRTQLVPVTHFSAHKEYITRILLSPDVKKLATCSADHTAKIWEVKDIEPVPDEEGPKPYPLEATLNGHQRWVWDCAFSADSAYLDIRLRMRGVYMAWACIVLRPGLPETLSADWHEAIVTVGPSPYATPSIVAKNLVTVHFIHEFGGVMFYDARVKVLIMGQLRRGGASIADGIDEALGAYVSDVMVTVASLSRDNWEPHETRERMKTLKSQRTFAEKYMDARDKVQKQVDRIPVHWAGVRTEGAAMRDQAMGPGGFWIAR
ncbi:Target of rapamycin complex subunit LST8 like protein [Verticillium longisporum]|nr:Target of rapamycin complex subunit LST8 like protein [Verticillium longisporum]